MFRKKNADFDPRTPSPLTVLRVGGGGGKFTPPLLTIFYSSKTAKDMNMKFCDL